MVWRMAVCFERGVKPSFVALGRLPFQSSFMKVCFERGVKPRVHRRLRFTPLSKQTSVCALSLNTGSLKKEVCFERGGKPREEGEASR